MAKLSDLMVGFRIAQKIHGEDAELGGADHDEIYLLPPDANEVLSEEDKLLLKKHNWLFSDRNGWYHFV